MENSSIGENLFSSSQNPTPIAQYILFFKLNSNSKLANSKS